MRFTPLLSRAALAAAAMSAPALAIEMSLPQPLPIERAIPAARDLAFPGTIDLAVDATDVTRGIFKVTETIPAAPGRLYLLYPQWLPGNHAPRGPIDDIANLSISANGRPLAWKRDPVDVYAIAVDVPGGATTITLSFDYVSPTTSAQGRVVMTDDMLNLQWNLVAFYPAGYFTRRIMVAPSAELPAGWGLGTALEPLSPPAAGRIAFRPVSFETLVDSPMLAGRHYRQIQLSQKVRLNIAADTAAELQATDQQIAAHRRLVDQATRLFGAEHYDHYDFLLFISDRLGGIGLEHQRSSENGVATGYFTRWDEQTQRHNLLPHEYAHSWNGKYRRGADLYTPDYSVPMRNSLLWVYEGQTQLWGYVLQARSGLVSVDDTLSALAMAAAQLDARPGRQWRPLIDTTNDPIIAARRPQPWTSLQRSEDYYNEGMLVWLDVDMQLRELTGGKRSLDDFARAFFGMRDGDWGTLTYSFDDVVAALNEIARYDWAGFLSSRVDQTRPHAPLDWITRGGYRLVYSNKPSTYWETEERRRKIADFSHSLGLTIDNGDRGVEQVIWGGPAFAAGITNSDSIVAVAGQAYDGGRLAAQIDNAVSTREPIQLLIRRGNQYRSVAIPYHGGNRYPRLEREGAGPGWLDLLLRPRP